LLLNERGLKLVLSRRACLLCLSCVSFAVMRVLNAG
jgi:hypothetical protein